MGLNGIQIFKYLPGGKKLPEANCKECGFSTCMAFALKVAQKQAEISLCKFAPIELISLLGDAFKVQQHKIVFGPNLVTGDETVMFRHDKTFVNRTVIALSLETDDKHFYEKLNKYAEYSIERIGETFKVDAINLIDKGNLIEQANKVVEKGFGLILQTNDKEKISNLIQYNPIFNTNIDSLDFNANLCVNVTDLEEIKSSCSNILTQGYKNLVINLSVENKNIKQIIEELTYIRRFAIIEKNDAFTYPVMTHLKESNLYKLTAMASLLMCRYSNIIVLDEFNEALLATLFTLRQNLYTDPQKPLQVESKIYEANDPNDSSIVLLTTNFALTYFAVLNEIESSSIPAYIAITPSDGMSVLTAWSAEKFTADIAAKVIKDSILLKEHKNKRIIIPGLLSHMKDELEESIEGWEIIVGPIEAFMLPDFIKNISSS